MFRVFLFLFLVFSLRAEVSPDVDTNDICDSYPCTLSVAGAVSTADENDELTDNWNAAAACGNELRLTAGDIWEVQTVNLHNDCADGSPLIITTTEAAKLPLTGHRLTEAYSTILPTIRITGSGSNGRLQIWAKSAAYGNAASNITFRGVRFNFSHLTSGSPSLYMEMGTQDDWDYVGPIEMIDSGDHKTFYSPMEYIPQAPILSDEHEDCRINGQHYAGSEDITINVNGSDFGVRADCLLGDSRLLELSPWNGGYNPTWNGSAYVPVTVSPKTETFAENALTYPADGLYTFRNAVASPYEVTITVKVSPYRLWTDFPKNIIFDRVLFGADRLAQMGGNALQLNGQGHQVIDSTFQDIKGAIPTEIKAISGAVGCKSCLVRNSWIEAAGSIIFFGGNMTPLHNDVVRDTDIENNVLYRPQRWRGGIWAASTYVEQGSVWWGLSNNTSHLFLAMNSGMTGATEPTWSTTTCPITNNPTQNQYNHSVLSSTSDNEVTWKCWASGSGNRYDLKNSFELKNGKNIKFKFNGVKNMWTDSQAATLNIKNESLHTWGQRSTVLKDIYLEHNWVETGASMFAAIVNHEHVPFSSYFETLYGRSTWDVFGPIYIRHNAFIDHHLGNWSIAGNRTGACASSGQAQFNPGSINPFYVENNLFDSFSHTGNAGAASCTTYWLVNGVQSESAPLYFRNNIAAQATGSTRLFSAGSSSGGSANGRRAMNRNGVVPQGTSAPSDDTAIPANRFSGNLLLGVTKGGCTGNNQFPTTNTNNCDPGNETHIPPTLTNVGFAARTNKNYKLLPGTSYKISGTNDRDPGPDWSFIPRIVAMDGTHSTATVHVAGQMAVITYRVYGKAAEWPGSIVVSSTQDMLSPIADLDPATYTRPDATDGDWLPAARGERRWIVLGRNVPLNAGTYHYKISHGGGFALGSFTVTGSVAGTTTHTIRRNGIEAAVDNLLLEYGTSYSAATDTISAGGTVAASCTAGANCTVSATVDRGTIVYTRWRERTSDNTVLRSGRVILSAIP